MEKPKEYICNPQLLKVEAGQTTEIHAEGTEGVSLPSDINRVGDCPSVGKQSHESVISETNPSCFGTYEVGICESRSIFCGKNEKCRYATEHPTIETKDDLIGLTEPEPPWQDTGCKDPMFIQDQEIQIQWTKVETSLAILRNLHIARGEAEFWGRAKMVMEGIR
jgi:hypothetical protein